MNNILLLGGGGHFKSVLDSLICSAERGTSYGKIGLVVNERSDEKLPENVVFAGCDDDLSVLRSEYSCAFITVGSVGNISVRKKLYNKVKELGFILPNIIDPTASVSRFSSLGEGVYVGKHACVNAGSKIGNCCIINTASVVEHDCEVGGFVHVSPAAVLCGGVKVGFGAHIGAGATIRQGLSIGENAVIGMGSVVVKDIGKGVTAYGNPCRISGEAK